MSTAEIALNTSRPEPIAPPGKQKGLPDEYRPIGVLEVKMDRPSKSRKLTDEMDSVCTWPLPEIEHVL